MLIIYVTCTADSPEIGVFINAIDFWLYIAVEFGPKYA